MEKKLLLGDEAVAQAAVDAGIGGAFSYPGTPSTEIFEFLEKHSKDNGYCARWSGNEKVAYEEALGMSFTGKRAIVSMKSVGINVAADPFVCSGLTGVGGGIVVVVADDPGMHSSQNEQDVRYYADLARIPCFEPSSQQECYDMTREAFRLSEEYRIPVLLRLVTRVAHSRAPVAVSEPEKRAAISIPQDTFNWVLLPARSRELYDRLLDKKAKLVALSAESRFNSFFKAKSSGKGIIACGTGYNYAREALSILGEEVEILKMGFYPLSPSALTAFLKGKQEVLVLEDGYPYVEERILGVSGIGPKIMGRMDRTVNRTGELNPTRVLESISKFLGVKLPAREVKPEIPSRPPALCPGCPHIDTYKAMKDALASRKESAVFADIGCYTLGALKPFEAIQTCVEMGASVGMAKGAAQSGLKYAVAVVGDSTFEHSCLTGLLGAAKDNVPMTLIILDNDITAMTGAQESLVNGDKLVRLVKGLGVDERHIRIIKPLPANHPDNVAIIGEELDYSGLSVVIAQRECIQILGKKK